MATRKSINQARYDATHCKSYTLKLNTETDKDIIEKLSSVPNVQGYIKQAIRNDIHGTITMDSKLIGTLPVPKTEREEKKMKNAYRIIHHFPGQHTWQELNDLIRFDSGVEEPYCETEEDYIRAVKDGFIKFDGKETTVWIDD